MDVNREQPRQRRFEPVITFTAPGDPNPQLVYDSLDRIRIWDSEKDRYGWAELTNFTWES